VKLSELVESEGYGFVIETSPTWEGHKILGDPPALEGFVALMCEDDEGNRYVACRTDSLDFVYSAAHEIAEDRFGHEHTAWMFSMQCNILAGWIRKLNNEGEFLHDQASSRGRRRVRPPA
jgi:hypothetical protein